MATALEQNLKAQEFLDRARKFEEDFEALMQQKAPIEARLYSDLAQMEDITDRMNALNSAIAQNRRFAARWAKHAQRTARREKRAERRGR